MDGSTVKKRGKYQRFSKDNPKPTECTLDYCKLKYYAKGLCHYHYGRQLDGYSIEQFVPKKALPCSFDGCDRLQTANGYCGGHNAQRWVGNELKPLRTFLKEPDEKGRVCSKCDEFQPWSEYYTRKRKNVTENMSIASFYWSYCKGCAREIQTVKNRAKQNAPAS